MAITEKDREYMQLALSLAAKGVGYTNPNPMVGAVIVKDDQILGQGYHKCCGQGHAEVEAFKDAGDADVRGATIYVTLEPCSHYGKTPPCADKIIEKGIRRAVIGAPDPNPLVSGRGIAKLQAAGIEVVSGLMAEESIRLNEIFMKYIVDKKPFVLYKSAMSLDGKTATSAGESQWISCEASREEVHRLRNQYMSIMVGIGTVLADDPMLNCRIPGGKDPVRVVVDSQLRIPTDCRLVQSAGDIPLIVACLPQADPDKRQTLIDLGADVLTVGEKDGHVDMAALVSLLGQMGIDSVLLEGGPTLAFAAFEAGIIDKVQIYAAPKILGGVTAKTPLGGKGFEKLSQAPQLKGLSARTVGDDICITGYLH